MQFKHPEVLYFLAFLVIPVLVHLFQLQRFTKVLFTNVTLLKKIVLQTRKSSQIKKWLVLATRMLTLSAVVFAFAQPYFSNKKANEQVNNIIYLDNSLSINTKNKRGNSLQIAKQDIAENISDSDTYSLLTNTEFYKNLSASDLKNRLKTLDYSSVKTDLNSILLKIANSKQNESNKILISDFQNTTSKELNQLDKKFSLIQIIPEEQNNLSIDSVYVTANKATNFTINVLIKNQGKEKTNIPIAIYNKTQLISKQTFNIDNNATKTIHFIVQKTPAFLGKVTINYADAFAFDNNFYFAINNNKKIKVLAIGKNNEFLSRIYNEKEFDFSSSTLKNTDYNKIEKQQLIILNEPEDIPKSLLIGLNNFIKNGGNLVIIPNTKADINSYNNFFASLSVGKIINLKKDTLKITDINFKHPVFSGVFEKKVKNFQYPTVNSYFTNSFTSSDKIVSYETKKGFIKQVNLPVGNLFWVSSALNKKNSNFVNSPLIVPIFYNIGQQSLRLPKLYYIAQKSNKIDINAKLKKDEVISLTNEKESFIPLQQIFQNKVTLTTHKKPDFSGFYTAIRQKDTLTTLAFNYQKQESSMQFLNLKKIDNKNLATATSVKSVLQKIKSDNTIHWLWKWFLALAVVSLLLEILILKFFKK